MILTKRQKFFIGIAFLATILTAILIGLLGITASVMNLPQLGIIGMCLVGALFYLHFIFVQHNRSIQIKFLAELNIAVEKQKRVSRHECMNFLQVIQSYLEMDNIEAALEYIDSISRQSVIGQQDFLLDIPEIELVLFRCLHKAKKRGVIFDMKVERISQVTWDLNLVVELLNSLLNLLIGDDDRTSNHGHRVFFHLTTGFDQIEIIIGADSAEHLLVNGSLESPDLIKTNMLVNSLISKLHGNHHYHQDNQLVRWSLYLPNA